MRRTANWRLSGPLLVPSPKLTGWSLIESVPSAKSLASETAVNCLDWSIANQLQASGLPRRRYRTSRDRRFGRDATLAPEPDAPDGVLKRGGDALQDEPAAGKDHAKTGVEQVLAAADDGVVTVHLMPCWHERACLSSRADRVVVLETARLASGSRHRLRIVHCAGWQCWSSSASPVPGACRALPANLWPGPWRRR